MKIAIIGLGLIGGSMGLKLRTTNSELKVIGIPRREETIAKAIELGAIDEGTTDHKKGVIGVDLVFICTPINLIVPILTDIAPNLKKGAIVTDVGSSKEQIVAEAAKILPKTVFFIGGHPMAGKEKVKLEEAEANLFDGKKWILTPTKKTNKNALEQLTQLIVLMGAKIVTIEPQLHDLVVAAISHMPLAVSAALVNTVVDSKKGKKEMMDCAASGFRDTTRIASGDPILGVDMFTTNKKAVLQLIESFKKSLTRLAELIEGGNVDAINDELEKAKNFRDSIYS